MEAEVGCPTKKKHRFLAAIGSQYSVMAFFLGLRKEPRMNAPELGEYFYCVKPPSLWQLVTVVCHLWWQRADVNSASESPESPESPTPRRCKGWASLGQSPVLYPVSPAPWRLCSLRCADSSQLERLPLMNSQTKHGPFLGPKSPATWQ